MTEHKQRSVPAGRLLCILQKDITFALLPLLAILWLSCAPAQRAECADQRPTLSDTAASSGSDTLTVSLNGEWDFLYSPDLDLDENKLVPVLPTAGSYAGKMIVPGYWDDNLDHIRPTPSWSRAKFNPEHQAIVYPRPEQHQPDTSLPFLVGVGYYKKTVSVPQDWAGRCVTLQVGGTRMYSWVFINGEYVGEQAFYSLPFEMRIDRYLKTGADNEIVIVVANNNPRKMGQGCAARGYQGRSAGIYRPICLKVCGAGRIADLYIYPREANKKLVWNVELDGDFDPATSKLEWVIHGNDDGAVAARGFVPVTGKSMSWTTETYGLKPWSDNDPNLYRIELTLRTNDAVQDRLAQAFGMRTIERVGTDLFLNGLRILLRGGTNHPFYPLTCTAPTDVRYFREIIRIQKALGFNWIRNHTSVPSEEFMQAADELGMMLQVESTDAGTVDGEWIETVRACRKHPSVIIYCCGNEAPLDEKKTENLSSRADLVGTHAPDALFTPQSALFRVDRDLGDDREGVASDPFPHNRRRLGRLTEFSDALISNGPWKTCVSYETAGVDRRTLDAVFSIYRRPVLIHEAGIIGNYLNLDLENRYQGTRTGADLYAAPRKYLTECGIIDKAPTYYRNSCKWQGLLRKNLLENLRKCEYIDGYNYLGPNDHHWCLAGYPGGIMNEFWELKPGESAADVLRYNGESVILLDVTHRRNLVAGRSYCYPIMASLYGSGGLDSGRLVWWVTDDRGRVHDRGEIPLRDVSSRKVVTLGTIDFQVQNIEAPVKLTLYARLSGGEYEVANDWCFWAFPSGAVPSITAGADDVVRAKYGARYGGLEPIRDQKLRVAHALDVDAVRFMAEGGRVVLLGVKPFEWEPGPRREELQRVVVLEVKPFSTRPTSFDPGRTGRSVGNLATVIADHPLMRKFPHDGYCDWQFYSMLEGGSAVQFNDIDLPWDPIIDIASSFKFVLKQGNLFEYRVGRGGLLVCTMNMDTSDPGAMYLLDTILTYAAGDEFRPKDTASPDTLLRLLGAKDDGVAGVPPPHATGAAIESD